MAEAEKLGVGVTSSILTDVQRSAEIYLWLMEAHIQKPRQAGKRG